MQNTSDVAPDSADLFARGNRAADRGEWAEAVQLYQRLLQIEPRHVMARNNLCYSYVRLGMRDLGAACLQGCLALKPDLALALFNIVEALQDAPRDFELIPHLRKLVELQPQASQHAFALANILAGAGRTAESLF